MPPAGTHGGGSTNSCPWLCLPHLAAPPRRSRRPQLAQNTLQACQRQFAVLLIGWRLWAEAACSTRVDGGGILHVMYVDSAAVTHVRLDPDAPGKERSIMCGEIAKLNSVVDSVRIERVCWRAQSQRIARVATCVQDAPGNSLTSHTAAPPCHAGSWLGARVGVTSVALWPPVAPAATCNALQRGGHQDDRPAPPWFAMAQRVA